MGRLYNGMEASEAGGGVDEINVFTEISSTLENIFATERFKFDTSSERC